MDLHVLIVEDSEDDALLEVRELRKGGFAPQFERVQTAEAMQAAMGRRRWDVLLVDYSLPEFSGLAALELAQKLDPDAPVIIVSGKIDDETAVACMKAGAQDYIFKGNFHRLSVVVKRELGDSANRREQRRLEHEVQNAKERLDLALRGSGTGVWDLDLTTNTLVLSETCTSMLGLEAGEGPGTLQELLELVHSGDRGRYNEAIAAQQAGTSQEISLELRLRHKNGDYPWFLCRGRIADKFEEQHRVVGTYINITERRKMETRVRRLERLFAVGQLLGGMAHEMNNPLFILTGQLQLLEEKLARENLTCCQAEMRSINSACNRIRHAVERFLALAAPWTQEIRRCSVATILANVLDLLKDDIAPGIATDVRVAPDLPEIECDPRSLREVFQSLVINAMQAMGKRGGQGRLTVTAALVADDAGPQERQLTAEEGWIEVSIRDNGPGIAPEQRAKLFEPFISSGAPEDGPGLGLWTVRALLLSMRGMVTCETETGRGTTFVVRLPVTKEPAPVGQPGPETASSTKRSEHPTAAA